MTNNVTYHKTGRLLFDLKRMQFCYTMHDIDKKIEAKVKILSDEYAVLEIWEQDEGSKSHD